MLSTQTPNQNLLHTSFNLFGMLFTVFMQFIGWEWEHNYEKGLII